MIGGDTPVFPALISSIGATEEANTSFLSGSSFRAKLSDDTIGISMENYFS
jgi:hypothetical protein